MIKVVLTNILVQGGVIYPYINGFLYVSCLPPVLSSYDVEVVVIYGVSWGLGMPMYRWWLFLSVPFFHLVSCLSLLYTPHCSLVEGPCSCRLNHFCCPWGLYLWVSSGFVLWWCFPLKCTCIPYLRHMCLMFSAVPLVYGMTTCPMVFFVVLLLVVRLVGMLLFVVPLFSSLVLLLIFVALVSSQLLLRTLLCTLLMAQ